MNIETCRGMLFGWTVTLLIVKSSTWRFSVKLPELEWLEAGSSLVEIDC